MKFGEVLPFLANAMTSLKFKQWEGQSFKYDSIPSTLMHRAFHIAPGQFDSGPANQNVHLFAAPYTIRIFFKGYRNPIDALNEAMNAASDVCEGLLRSAVRLSTPGIKDIRPRTIQPIQISTTNDNSVLVEMIFDVVLIYNFK